MNLTKTLTKLINEGNTISALVGSSGSMLWSEYEPAYVDWRLQAMSALIVLGQPGKHLLQELEADNSGLNPISVGRVLGALKGALVIAEHQDVAVASSNQSAAKAKDIQEAIPSRVFVVHGHNEVLLLQTARFLEKIGIEPVILFERAGKGQTIIEKLECNSDVQYAVVLLTPDDIGKAAKDEGQTRSRARQNVVMELGYFLGKLGRSSVVALYDESVELPSDYRGVEYIKIDAGGAWKMNLARELMAAGIPVDMGKAL